MATRMGSMTTRERVRDYAQRKNIKVPEAREVLLRMALDTVDARRKGAQAANSRPGLALHLEKARAARKPAGVP